MKTEIRYAGHPADVKNYDTTRLRKEFLIEKIFIPDEITLVYSMYDRYIVGGAMPATLALKLETIDDLKAPNFLDRREMGIINVGGPAIIETASGNFELDYKEALYLGKETRDVVFKSKDPKNPAKLYINSAPAHHAYPSKKVTKKDAEIVVTGSAAESNHRSIIKLLVNSVLPTCQLQMGMTEFAPGSVWNTMPVHTHNRRMEAYFYFEVPEKQAICHFMGDPDETRHIWMVNDQAVLSPSWSIHSAAGTSGYTFIWGMAGENLDYGDKDERYPDTLK
ncbi:MAG TPA: 5-dehydro-4-deoxy-D-glucuronate isomerase [Bacteroidales bacterium]|nr:5-dehydro-4-deoxy-D-glucuronate isomerase [Bacteroidales bacterium]HOW41692.1 5-dehydro-4-deoxy-D-glucuronate isomerase [Bacteroidales bacterium]HOX75263.1 5-dehydro-4-deoxy-D-glucuronate isomerase [Bacteroidales bacterium]HPM87160.1 5-dehydro-4-deoxy-D-glucuronate isomerase [Bacteroidales bacterium]HQM69555.1 5-dehydro-4-deoxy-D-glucuronate isomerase [Bacteroidales bacterium]